MSHNMQFFIDGAWVDPITPQAIEVIDPSTEEAFTTISGGSAGDVDKAVAAAKAAFESFSRTSPRERLQLLESVLAEYDKRYEDIAQACSQEMGAPLAFARDAQAWIGQAHLREIVRVMKEYKFAWMEGDMQIVKEPIGVVGMITPWNWPLNQITCKVGPALAAGCTMVLKPSEVAPLTGIIFAEVMEKAGVPKGVFNLVNGDGASVGAALSAHPDVDMMSFTGSTRAGILVAKAAADTVKRVHQELGGKSPNILLPEADFAKAVPQGVANLFSNSGQSCNAPSRMLVPRARHEEVVELARAAAANFVVGDPRSENSNLGPVVSKIQFDKIQGLIEAGIAEGATLVAGGPGRPEGLSRGYYVRPTVFAGVTPEMRIAREEIFGPVLAIMPYDSEEAAIAEANNTVYGLAAYIQSEDLAKARAVASRMRAGTVYINAPPTKISAPFGGFKQSGNGREWSHWGLDEFLEIKGVVGYGA
ncbi:MULTISPECIES: aldehyde dehydrogenase family protein [unclassified Acidocella]|uniref:aldehyde dehydrogenase family protein n=1 Tax=unclassified Acidocella TaxID=2648610 RepID=UPI00028C9A9A|nr:MULTISPECIES: aldehyde dehydrogenase family protein [unclassified Acidocella]EKM98296.1 aldehyde dehydrogenase [Acidocella sp. MX-AZ02]WBO59352.1 aldehyde dehydrogenase family protein [Acidocella sp. MX-AZ03]